jgi:hypothetical protein
MRKILPARGTKTGNPECPPPCRDFPEKFFLEFRTVTGYETVTEERMAKMDERVEAAIELHDALSEFCNAACDSWEPSKWAAETKRNFERLCAAYNRAQAAGVVFDRPSDDAR